MIFESLKAKAPAYIGSSICLVSEKDYVHGIMKANPGVDDNSGTPIINFIGVKDKLVIHEKNIKNFSFSSPPLGYYYDAKQHFSAYLERIPHRAWRVGLTQNNVTESIIFKFDLVACLNSLEQIRSCQYPSFEAARELSKEVGIITPFSRRYAVNNNNLYHKGLLIGSITKANRVKVKTNISAKFHNNTIGSICGLTFYSDPFKVVDYEKEDF